MTLLLGIDIGTTALKLVVLDSRAGVVAQATRPHTLLTRHPGWSEEDPEEWWATTIDALQEITARVSANEIAAIGVTGMVPALVLLNAAGNPLRPAVLQNDARAVLEVEELRNAVDIQDFLARTGGVPNQQNVDPRWRWLAKHEPDTTARCVTLCGSYDFIAGRLTGERTLELNWAAESGLWDIVQRSWHVPYLQRAGIDPRSLPPVRQPSDIVGSITPEIALASGLRPGTPVVAGSADHVAAALAAGLTAPGDVLLKFGGAGDILAVTPQVVPDPHFYFDYHDIPGLSLINGCMASSGSLVRWFAQELGGGLSLSELDREASNVPAGSGGIVALPYALGEKTPIFDPEARAVFAGLMLHHTRAHLYRAVLEAVCYGFAHHLSLLRAGGHPVRRVLAADGGSRSPLWMSIAAGITGEPVQVVTGDAASALGVAFVAGMGVGSFTDWAEVQRFATLGPRYEPEPAAVQQYQQGHQVYLDLYERLRTLFPALGQLESTQ